jgi:hypothetical protein
MKTFNERLQILAADARQAAWPDQPAPPGFAARVAARAVDQFQGSGAAAWERLAVQMVWCALTLLLVCAALNAPYLRRASLLDCAVQEPMMRLMWSL